jgi:ankyrin repeat protein
MEGTPLQAAINFGQLQAVGVLIDAGAVVDKYAHSLANGKADIAARLAEGRRAAAAVNGN